MVEDTKMVDITTDEKTEKAETKEPSIPPLEAAALRLERLLGGGTTPNNDRALDFYTNPVKVVRRWLGTSSGAASSASIDSIKDAARKLLDPMGSSAGGRSILLELSQATESMDTEGGSKAAVYLSQASAREVESWLISLAVRLLWKEGKCEESFELSEKSIAIIINHLEDAALRITSTSAGSASSLFPLLARMYRLRSLVAGSLNSVEKFAALRIDMAKAHNLATIRRDVDSQATLLNCMLHDLLKHSQIEQAQKLLLRSKFPESASINQLCRYLYFSGRIQASRLEYTSSFSNLSQCLRKAPTNTGLGFRVSAQRLLVVVQLLMGEIPDRHIFFTTGMKVELSPYLAITEAVRCGDLAVFNRVIVEHATRFQKDGTYTLISRLAHQVVKAGLRKLHISYSRLSLQDVADRLGLPSAKSAEYVVAKAVRDGVLDATIYHKEGYVQSHDLVDVYATKEPAEAFHNRIAFCLTTHNDAVRGMRYPPDAYKKQLEASRGNRRKRGDDKTDEEKANELEEELEEDY